MKQITILDCTLRDGGYYTNWDFDKRLVNEYIKATNVLPIDYLEIGYRSPTKEGYFGEFFYCPDYLLVELREKSVKKLAIMLNEKDVRATDTPKLLKTAVGKIDMVRIAVDPRNLLRAIELAESIKVLGFEVGFNVMYMSSWSSQNGFLENLRHVNGVIDYFYMVDSYGGVYPEDVRAISELIKDRVYVPFGFHGHNNLELALINSLTAIDNGATLIDATITGMGRGAGNLRTELFLTVLNAKGAVDFDFNALSKVVDGFSKLHTSYQWGTNLPYMVSGANSLPQKDVMDWVGKRYYSFNSIIRALNNEAKGIKDNQKLHVFKPVQLAKKALIVGGGPSVNEHADAITNWLRINEDIVIIHASSKNAMVFRNLKNKQIFCLVGNEGHRMEDVFMGDIPDGALCILPPFPRKMGTYIPESLKGKAFELPAISFTDKLNDSHTAIALQTSVQMGVEELYVVGYDGYHTSVLGLKEQELLKENEMLFEGIKDYGITVFKSHTYRI